MVRGNRKVGLGVMGFADMLIQLGIPYASDEAVAVAEKLMRFIRSEAREASRELAEERGVFPNWEKSIYARKSQKMRNATVTSIAPTGTISIVAGAAASIEPLFALAYRRENVLGGQTLTELNPLFVDYAKKHGFYTDKLLRELRAKGSVADIDSVPDHAKRLFRTALEIAPSDHLAIQAAFQRHCCNAVSKTINLPESATPEDVCDIYRTAWELGLKGVTVYRYGSKSEQVLNLGAADDGDEDTQCSGGACPRCADG
jgi:ribonucleoside-diphosphate reductase alpha chain